MCTINVIMAVYNGEKYMREQIESILNNSHKDIKLSIYDDGSSDGSVLIAREYQEQFPNKIEVHENETNLGVVLNFLEGVRRSSEDYMMFCDQDDVWFPDKIEQSLAEMKKEEKRRGDKLPIAVFTDAKVVDEKLEVINKSFYQASALHVHKRDMASLMMENKLLGGSVMINNQVRRLLKPLPKYARMHDWWIALICQCFGSIVFLDRPTYLYRQHENNVIGNQNYISYFINRIRSLKKQKQALNAVIRQAAEFYKIYKGIIDSSDKRIIYEFASLHKYGWLKRRSLIIKNGYYKSGIIRNLGVLLLI